MEALIPFAFIFVIMYLLLIRPQQRQAKQARELIASVQEGDEIVLSSGIHGFVSSVDDEIIWVEVADGVELKVGRGSVASKIIDDDGDDDRDDDDDDDRDDDDRDDDDADDGPDDHDDDDRDDDDDDPDDDLFGDPGSGPDDTVTESKD